MELNFEPPVEGECIGRGISLKDKLSLTFHTIMIMFFVFLGVFSMILSKSDKHALMGYSMILFCFFWRFMFHSKFSEIDASRRLIYLKDGFLLKHSKYKLKKMSVISLVGNKLFLECEFERKTLIGQIELHEKQMEYKIEKRFSDKPHLLLEFLNTHARNTTPLLEK